MKARRNRSMPHQITDIVREASETDRAAAMAIFLLDNTGSIFGRWMGNLPAATQRMLFGRYIGKGYIIINGDTETVDHSLLRHDA